MLLNPNRYGKRILFASVYHISLVLIILSTSFPTQDRRYIGLYVAGFAESLPGFCIGMMSAIFQSFGIHPSTCILLKISKSLDLVQGGKFVWK